MHDYTLEWDYDVVVPERDFLEIAVRAKKRIAEDIQEFIPSFTIGFVKETKYLALYISGTESCPVVALDVENIRQAAIEYDVSLDTVITSTIMYELGHALQKIHGLDNDEAVAEEFAHTYWARGIIKKFWLS